VETVTTTSAPIEHRLPGKQPPGQLVGGTVESNTRQDRADRQQTDHVVSDGLGEPVGQDEVRCREDQPDDERPRSRAGSRFWASA